MTHRGESVSYPWNDPTNYLILGISRLVGPDSLTFSNVTINPHETFRAIWSDIVQWWLNLDVVVGFQRQVIWLL